jgi:hypothetical protein
MSRCGVLSYFSYVAFAYHDIEMEAMQPISLSCDAFSGGV